MKPIKKVALIGPMIIGCVIIYLLFGLDQYVANDSHQREEQLRQTIQEYAIACYAQEGSYPPDVYYLRDYYGLILEEQKYYYHYEIFASNVMPEIRVIRK